MSRVERPRPAGRRRSWWISLAVLAAALVLSIRLLLPDAVGEQVRRTFIKVLSEHYTGIEIFVDSGRYDPQRGVILAGIEFHDPTLPAGATLLLKIDRLLLESHLDLAAIKAGETPLRADRIIVQGVTANICNDSPDHWSLAKFLPLPKLGPGCPRITVNDLRLRLNKSAAVNSPALELNQLRVEIRRSTNAAGIDEQNFQLSGSGGFLDNVLIEGTISGEDQINLRGRVQRLSLDSRVYDRLPPALSAHLGPLLGLTTVADISWAAAGKLEQLQDNWQAAVQVHRGRFVDQRLPAALEDLQGRLTVAPSGLKISAANFTVDGANCQISGTTSGLQWPFAIDMQVSAKRLTLTDALMAALPSKGRELDEKLRPRGLIDLAGSAKFDRLNWDFEGDIECQGLSVLIDKFPYPVQNIRGRVHFQDKIARADNLMCRAGDASLLCSFQIAPSDSNEPHWIEVAGDGAVRIDESLVAALTPLGLPTSKLETFVRELSPAGGVRLLQARFGRDATGQPTKFIDLEVVDGRLRYSRFPYPLYEVRGHISVNNELVTLRHFQAQNNGGAQIQCAGNWTAIPELRAGKLDLTFSGFGIPLDDGLRTALPPQARQTWDTLSPAGVLERLEVRVEHGPESGPPSLKITAEQWANNNGPSREVSVTPAALPYRLNITRGLITMLGNEIIITDVDGYHGLSRLTAEGMCRRRDDGRWQLDINLLTGSRLRPDVELIQALPPDIRGSFAKLQLREPVSLRGNTQLILPNLDNPQTVFSWDVLLQLEGNRIGDAGPVHDIRGEIMVRGSASQAGTTAEGTVRIDSLHVNDLQLTGIVGPFSVAGTSLRLGSAVRDGDQPSEPIRGQIFAGQLGLVGEVLLSTGQFDVNIELDDANLPTMLTELGASQAGLSGQFGGEVNLEGNLGAKNLLRGSGSATLSEATLYQLPLIVQLLNQLSLTPTEDVAFTDGSTRFALDGDLLTLSDVSLWGNLVALHGGGTINGRHELDLSFNTRVSPQSIWSKMVRPLRSQKYTLWTIYVLGPLAEPRIERRALDAVGETLERLFPVIELDTAANQPGVSPRASTATRSTGASRSASRNR